MVETTREASPVVTESGGVASTGDETAATAGDETAATVGSNVRPGRPVGDAPALCLQGRNDHTLQSIPGTNSNDKGLIRDCAVCSNTPLAGSSKGARHRSSYECRECKKALCIYPCFKRFHTLTVCKAECTDAFHSLPQVPVGSGVQEAPPAAKHGRRH